MNTCQLNILHINSILIKSAKQYILIIKYSMHENAQIIYRCLNKLCDIESIAPAHQL